MFKKDQGKEPKYIASPLNNKMINYKVYYMSLQEKFAAFFATFFLGGVVGYIFYGGMFKQEGEATQATYISNLIVFLLVGGIAAKVFIPAIRDSLKDKRDKKLRKQFMDLLETLSASLSAGNTVNDSFVNANIDMRNQYSENDCIMQELVEIVAGMENGKTLEEMIFAFGSRSNNEDIENFGNVISNCYRLGGNFKETIRKTRDIVGDKIAIEDEIKTKLASNKLQHNAMCVMPIILVAIIKLSNPSFAENLSSGIGVVTTTIAVAIFVASYFWGQKIIDVK